METEKAEGYDRIFQYPGGTEYKMEYKTDFQASVTGNVFIETVSMDIYDKPGWAYTSKADYLIYYIPGASKLLVIPARTIRLKIERWKSMYPELRVENKGYCAYGVIVPLVEFEGYCLVMEDFLMNHKLEAYDVKSD